MKRIFLFILTNLAVVFVINITLRLLGVDRWLNETGGINFSALLVLSAVIGFAGSLVRGRGLLPLAERGAEPGHPPAH